MAREQARSAESWKNQALDPDDFGGAPALKPETIRPHTATVITVTEVDMVELDDPDSTSGKRKAIVVHSEEYPEHRFWLNKSGTRTCIDKLGDVPNKWIGDRLPLVVVRVNNPKSHSSQQSLQVAPAGEWDEMFAEFDGKPASRVTRGKAKRGRPTARRK